MKEIITGPSWNPVIPDVYQIEAVAVCDLACPTCPTGIGSVLVPKDKLMSLDLFYTIVERDLGGSSFVELQMRGEPTLHKHLREMVEALKGRVFVGLSTHGGLMHIPRVLEALLKLDYLTISIEGGEREYYEKHRVGGNFDRLIANIDLLVAERGRNIYPIVDLQLIEFEGVERQLQLVKELAGTHGWRCTIRTINDTFRGQYDENVDVQCTDLCLNPWMSTSIQSNGDAVGCCMDFGGAVVYGNVSKQPLEEIWQTSPVLHQFRKQHLTGNSALPALCRNCYARSPALLHRALYEGAMKAALMANVIAEQEGLINNGVMTVQV